jgi:hypothetical protein
MCNKSHVCVFILFLTQHPSEHYEWLPRMELGPTTRRLIGRICYSRYSVMHGWTSVGPFGL